MKKTEPIADAFKGLEATLGRQLQEYRLLRQQIERRRDALRRADAAGIRAALELERATIARIDELDRARAQTANALFARLGVAPATLTALLVRAPGESRASLEVVAAQLRDEIDGCRRLSGVVRAAADALAQHVAGVLQTVHQLFASSQTYGSAGRLAGALPIRSLDLVS